MKASISVVIPVYNSADSLAELYQRLVSTLQKITADFEIIMVDDHSEDRSYKQLVQLHQKDHRVKVIKLAKNSGQQNALICGFNYVKGDYVVTLDDDLQHRPEEIVDLYSAIKKGYDVVYSIAEDREYSLYRKIGSKMTDFLFGLITPRKPGIKVSSFRIISGELVEKVIEYKAAFVYISAVILQQTDNIGNIYSSRKSRKHGKSNYNFIKLARLFIKLYIYHGNLPVLKLFRSERPQYIVEKEIGFSQDRRGF